MPYAAPGRLRGFFASRSGRGVLVVGALALAGATAFALRGDDEPPLVPAVPETTTTTAAPPVQSQTGVVLVGASTSPDVRSLAAALSRR